MNSALDKCMELVIRNVQNAIWYSSDSSWGMAEVWLRHAEQLMRDGASS